MMKHGYMTTLHERLGEPLPQAHPQLRLLLDRWNRATIEHARQGVKLTINIERAAAIRAKLWVSASVFVRRAES
jgi:hypothetical protein